MLLMAQDQSSNQSVKNIKTSDVNIAVGIDKIIEVDFEFDSDISIGDSSLFKIKPDIAKRKITLIGAKSGVTSLTLKDKNKEERVRYIVTVSTNEKSKTVTEIRELLSDVEGIEVGIKGGKVYVGGYIVVPSDIGKASTVLSKYPDVLRLIEMHPQTQRIIARKMTEELARFNFKNASVRVVNNAYWVEGVVGSEAEKLLVQEIVQAYLPEKIESLSANSERSVSANNSDILILLSINSEKKNTPQPLPKQIKVSTQFVELSKDYNKVFGFKWAPLLSDGGAQIQIGKRTDGSVSTNSSNGFSAVLSNLFPKMQSLKNAGYARIIQSGTVITEDKLPGNIIKNTRIPIVLGSNDAARVVETNVSFNFKVTPEVKEGDKVRLDLKIDVSIPSGQGTDGTPISTSNSIATIVTVDSGQSAAIGGIVQTQDLTSYDKNDPAAIDDSQASSVFFNMLRSKSKSITKNQYVVFVTPEVIESASEGTSEIRRKFKRKR